MTVNKTINGEQLLLKVEGRLDTNTSPELEAVLKASYEGITELVFDCEKLEYVSSAGLRVLLAAQKEMNRRGSMKLQHVDESIMEIFEITGFVDFLTIEK